MNVSTYLQRRELANAQAPSFRKLCLQCLQPDFSCYCAWLKPFDPNIKFVILIHPLEFKKRIATGRLAHLNLKNSHLIKGQDYSADRQVNALLDDPSLQRFMLYPGPLSKNITHLSPTERFEFIQPDKKLTIFVIDGSWATARKMVRLSENLKSLQRICFTPPTPSNFRIRKQPDVQCYSTIEAIHQTIELFGSATTDQVNERPHDQLLDIFDKMVNRQIDLAHCGKPQRR